MKNHGISLRKFPFPYRCALSISSDIDLCDRARFIALHRFLNGGLGLPIADSFFGCAMNRRQLAFLEPDGSESADALFIRAAIGAGMIDTLHTWGDFNGAGPHPDTLRLIAGRMAEIFLRERLAVPLWVNHGAPENSQNLLFRLYASYQGDNPASRYYTADLLQTIGVRYYCSTDMVPWPLDAIWPNELLRGAARVSVNEIKNVVKLLSRRSRLIRQSKELISLCDVRTLRDGNKIWGATRFNRHPRGLWTRATRETLRYGLSASVLKELIASQGYCIVGTHLGLPAENSGDSLFPPEDVAALERLAENYTDKIIWVAPTGVLLTYNTAVKSLSWKVARDGPLRVVEIETVYDPRTGLRSPHCRECAGLTFYSPCPDSTVVRLRGTDLPVARNGHDETGRASVSVALPSAPDIACLGRT